ncbi:MAG: 2-oxoacid:acceptor oxidoreductase family protein [Spirochaetia bacterium]|nr:2-oxoacid:acceptor oxidoreductase family protein [Spirochaetia bacterium]
MSEQINIYLCGVGGQGIGLLSEAVLRAYDHAGCQVRGVDTHGLAQRGGIVRSHIRVGEGVFSPLNEPGRVDIVLALERTEALRGARDYLRPGGLLVYYDAYWQALPIRLGEAEDVTGSDIELLAGRQKLRVERVYRSDLADPRTQNMALLSHAVSGGYLPGLKAPHVKAALQDLLPEKLYEKNVVFLE